MSTDALIVRKVALYKEEKGHDPNILILGRHSYERLLAEEGLHHPLMIYRDMRLANPDVSANAEYLEVNHVPW